MQEGADCRHPRRPGHRLFGWLAGCGYGRGRRPSAAPHRAGGLPPFRR